MARHFALFKLVLIGILGLVLLVPVAMVGALVADRGALNDAVVREIGESWGASQLVVGPMLVVPYRFTETETVQTPGGVEAKQRMRIENAYFLPEALDATVTLETRTLRRGLYEAPVYTGTVVLSGSFAKPDLSGLDLRGGTVQGQSVRFSLAVSDLRGVRGRPVLTWGDTELDLQPAALLPRYNSGVHVVLSDWDSLPDRIPFSLALTLNGSAGIRLAPFGRVTRTSMVGDWPDPSFGGRFLPADRTVTDEGFRATWDISFFGRSYPQAWTDAGGPTVFAGSLDSYGVTLLTLVDTYRKVERALKYAVLFIAFAFAVFFLFEVLLGLAIHPIQYMLVGASLCVFFLLLLSLSELIAFGPAYALSVLLSIGLVGGYTACIVHSARRGGLMALGLGAGYGYLYGLLHLEDYALVLGAFGLFVLLAGIMVATRHVDWYNLAPRTPGRPAP